MRKQRRLAKHRDHDRVGDNAGENRGNERVGFEIVTIENLGGEERGAERRAEHGCQAGGDTGDEEYAPLALAHTEPAADQRAERAADLHRRPLASARPASAEGEDRGQHLYPDDSLAHDGAAVMEGLDHRVAAAAARLRRQDRQRARGQRAERRHDEEQVPAIAMRAEVEQALAGGAQRHVAADVLEEHALHQLEADVEHAPDEPRAQANDRGV
jgi:hypothetical protein